MSFKDPKEITEAGDQDGRHQGEAVVGQGARRELPGRRVHRVRRAAGDHGHVRDAGGDVGHAAHAVRGRGVLARPDPRGDRGVRAADRQLRARAAGRVQGPRRHRPAVQQLRAGADRQPAGRAVRRLLPGRPDRGAGRRRSRSTRLEEIATLKGQEETEWQIFLRAVGCNWLVCLAVWMALAATDVAGKILAIFFPIMAFVAMGFDHVVANMFFLPAAIFTGAGDLTWGDALHNWLFAGLGQPRRRGDLRRGRVLVPVRAAGGRRRTPAARRAVGAARAPIGERTATAPGSERDAVGTPSSSRPVRPRRCVGYDPR